MNNTFAFIRSNQYKLYESILIVLLTINSIANNINAGNISFLNYLSLISMTFIFLVGIIFDFNKIKGLSQYIYIAFLIFFLFIFKFSFLSFTIVCLALSFWLIPINDIVPIYRKIILFQLIYGFITSLIGLSPLRNPQTGTLTFGFINENSTGALLAILGLMTLFSKKSNKLLLNIKWYSLLFLVAVVGMEMFLFNDGTAVIKIILFVLLLPFKNKFLKGKILQLIGGLVPLGLCFLTFWVSYNYSYLSSNWISKLNNMITWRIYIWNYYLTNYPLSLFPSNWVTNNQLFFGAFDGTYAYLGVFSGLLMTLFIVLGLSLANIKLLKNGYFYLFTLMIVFEVSGFSENIIINNEQCFALIFAALSYSISWPKLNQEP